MSTSLVDSDGVTRFVGELSPPPAGPFTVLGPVTLTAADFAANWDIANAEGAALVAELLAGDLVWEYRVVVTTQVAQGIVPGGFVTLGVVDAGPGSWATPFATTPTNVAGDTGPSFVQANAAAASEQGSLMTADDTLYLVYGDAGGPPIAGNVTVYVFVVRP